MKTEKINQAIIALPKIMTMKQAVDDITRQISFLENNRRNLKQVIKDSEKLFSFCNNHRERVEVFKLSIYFPQIKSARSLQIIYLISQAYSSKQIAERCFISIKGVKYHKTEIYKKIGVRSEMELLRLIKQHESMNDQSNL